MPLPEGLPIIGRHIENPVKVIDRIAKQVKSGRIKPDKLITDADFLLQTAGEEGREKVQPFLEEAVRRAPEGVMQTALIERLSNLYAKDKKTGREADTIRRYIQIGEDLGVTGKPEGQQYIDALKEKYPEFIVEGPKNAEEFIAMGYKYYQLDQQEIALDVNDPIYEDKVNLIRKEQAGLAKLLSQAENQHPEWYEAYRERRDVPPLADDAWFAQNLNDFAAALEKTNGLVAIDTGRLWNVEDLKAIIAHAVMEPTYVDSLPNIPDLKQKIGELVAKEDVLPVDWWASHLIPKPSSSPAPTQVPASVPVDESPTDVMAEKITPVVSAEASSVAGTEVKTAQELRIEEIRQTLLTEIGEPPNEMCSHHLERLVRIMTEPADEFRIKATREGIKSSSLEPYSQEVREYLEKLNEIANTVKTPIQIEEEILEKDKTAATTIEPRLSKTDALPSTEIGRKLSLGGQEFQLTQELSGGKYGKVYLATAENGQKTALKVRNPGLRDLDRLHFEGEMYTLVLLADYQREHGLTVNGELLTPEFMGRGLAGAGFNNSFFAMGFAEGIPLDEIIRGANHQLTEKETIIIGEQFSRVLEALHSLNKSYFDFQTRNIFWDQVRQKITVVDWNLLAPAAVGPAGDRTIREAQPAEDLWNTAKLLLKLSTGASEEDIQEQGFEKILERSSISPAFKNILAKALDEDPSQRFQNAQEFRQSLEDLIGQIEPPLNIEPAPAPVPEPELEQRETRVTTQDDLIQVWQDRSRTPVESNLVFLPNNGLGRRIRGENFTGFVLPSTENDNTDMACEDRAGFVELADGTKVFFGADGVGQSYMGAIAAQEIVSMTRGFLEIYAKEVLADLVTNPQQIVDVLHRGMMSRQSEVSLHFEENIANNPEFSGLAKDVFAEKVRLGSQTTFFMVAITPTGQVRYLSVGDGVMEKIAANGQIEDLLSTEKGTHPDGRFSTAYGFKGEYATGEVQLGNGDTFLFGTDGMKHNLLALQDAFKNGAQPSTIPQAMDDLTVFAYNQKSGNPIPEVNPFSFVPLETPFDNQASVIDRPQAPSPSPAQSSFSENLSPFAPLRRPAESPRVTESSTPPPRTR